MELAKWTDETIKRYTVVVEKYPEFAYANLARYGLAMAYYRKGDFDKAKDLLAAIPAAERSGDLAIVPYQIADILIRTAPLKADNAITAGRVEEALKTAIEQLEGYAGPTRTHRKRRTLISRSVTAGRAGRQHRRAGRAAKRTHKAARQAYEQILNRFQKSRVFPQAVFERAKVMAMAKDVNGAINELRRFTNDPLKNAPIAPLAQVHLATLYRSQNRPQDAVTLLAQTRQTYEAALQNDPTRAAWIPLVQYHHAIALREAGKTAEARTLLSRS